MKLNQKQKDATSKSLLDIGKIVLATFVIGGLIPNSPIKAFHLVAAIVISVILSINDAFKRRIKWSILCS